MTSEKEMSPFSSAASPEGWSWSMLDASRPRRGIEHLTVSDVMPVTIDQLRPTDIYAGSQWTLTTNIPIIVVDTSDAYWAFEKVLNKLHSFGKTGEEAKGDLLDKLGGHLKLLSSLESPRMAPILRLELEFLRTALRPVEAPGP